MFSKNDIPIQTSPYLIQESTDNNESESDEENIDWGNKSRKNTKKGITVVN